MKLKSTIECPYCGEQFETASGVDQHRSSKKCLAPEKLLELGWTQGKYTGSWRRPKGRRST